ncbi:hypothetical protein OG725_37155 (plasmid) [Streptomyces sp. NBC_01213]|uniref:hypothetical protein n=1 Tax=Streptomyces sp. NBC_01213 TaxID=2903776 RepID=UPI00352C1684|nr:hypothetical protein OG725_37155 [Streptomyces sp. NBC_01213]
MPTDLTAADESETLASALRAYLSETRFSFTGLTGKEATRCITGVVAQWAHTSGWKAFPEAHMRYIDPPRMQSGGCVTYWSPPWNAYLDLRLFRPNMPPVAVEIDRENISTAMDKLRDEALRGRPALWIRWHGTLRDDVAAGVARLHLTGRSTRSPARYSMSPVTTTAAITAGEIVTPEARVAALLRDEQRKEQEKRTAACPPAPPVIR